MNIKQKNFPSTQSLRLAVVKNESVEATKSESVAEGSPQDSVILSDSESNTRLSGKDIIQIGVASIAGAGLGATPGVGALTNLMGSLANGKEDETAAVLGLLGVASNVAASVALKSGGGTLAMAGLALPALLGAVTWGSFAYNKAQQG